MKEKHYATIFTNKNVIPTEKTTRVATNDILDMTIPIEAYRVITFDRIIDEIEYNGKKYKVATKKLNHKIYHIGKFENLDQLAKKDELFVKLAKNNNCIGMVTSYSGLESMVFEGEGIVEIKNNNKHIIKDCTMKVDEIFESKKEEKSKTDSINTSTDENGENKEN